MVVAYWTTDFVNLNLAREWAEECGASLEQAFFKGRAPTNSPDAVLYDLDYLPPDNQREILATLTNGPLHHSVAVHSYHLADELLAALQARGVIVGRRLEKGLIERLRKMVIAHATYAAPLAATNSEEGKQDQPRIAAALAV